MTLRVVLNESVLLFLFLLLLLSVVQLGETNDFENVRFRFIFRVSKSLSKCSDSMTETF